MSARFRSLVMVIVCALLPGTVAAGTRLADEDIQTLASKALQWAVDGGFAAVKTLPASEPINVIDYNLPRVVKLSLGERKVHQASYLVLQGLSDLHGDRFAFAFDRFVLRGERAQVSLHLRLIGAKDSTTTPPAEPSAKLEFERHGNGWELVTVDTVASHQE